MKKKVLVVDDSALMRRVISDIINADDQLTVANTANNGELALDLLLHGNQYDILLVDINMPKMDGVQFLKELHKNRIRIPTLVVSSIADQSTKETIEALELGAFDFVKKPKGPVGQAFNDFQNNILMRVYLACGMGTYRGTAKKTVEPEKKSKSVQRPLPKKEKLKVLPPVSRMGEKLVVIASSTGGPKALQSVIPLFPENFPYPVVVVQHMPEGFTASLAERLNNMSQLTVKEAEDGEPLKRGTVYIAKGGRQCELIQKEPGKYWISENSKPARGGLRPCADIFFESLVNTSFDEIICAVLTGMGSDGSKGISLIKECKKVKVVAQNEDTCVVYGMPRAAKSAGVVDAMVPLEDVAGTMLKKIGV